MEYFIADILFSVFQKKENVAQETRFRKRDKALFYGRKMIRKVKNISGQVRTSGQGKKRKMVMKFARKILQLKKDTDQEQLKVSIKYINIFFINRFNLGKELWSGISKVNNLSYS